MTDAQSIAALEARRVAAMLAGDAEALAALLSPEVVWIHSSGARDSRCSLLRMIRTGQLRYLSIDSTDVQTRQQGDLGTVSGRADIVAELSGNILKSTNLYVGIWAREEAIWQMVHLQSTGVRS